MQRGLLVAVYVIVVIATSGGGVIGAEGVAATHKKSLSNRSPVAQASRIESSADEKPSANRLQPLGSRGWPPTSSVAPGTRIGITWYEKQHNGTVGRQVDWGTDTTHGLSIHFLWTRLPGSNITQGRAYAYNYVTSNQDTVYEETTVQPGDEYAGYVGLDVTTDNRAVAGGHNN
ncbi:MAG: hypothetical protein ABIE70_09435 [bacterium]